MKLIFLNINVSLCPYFIGKSRIFAKVGIDRVMVFFEALTVLVKVVLTLVGIKEYATLVIVPEEGQHDQMQFKFIHRKCLLVALTPLHETLSVYSKPLNNAMLYS